MMACAAAHVNHAVLLLMVINLVAITSTSPSDVQRADEAHDGLPAASSLCAARISRSIDDGRTTVGGQAGGKHSQKTSANANGSPGAEAKAVSGGKAPRSSVFTTENSTVVWAQIGGTASLPCVVKKNSGTVLWLRQWPAATPTLLSVGVNKHTADDRYYVAHIRHLQNWGLVIKHVRVGDEGVYKCQVSTHPPTIILIHLKVTMAYAEIAGAPDLHLRAGSTLRLACEIRRATEPPEYVFWYHEDRMINYDAGVRALTDAASNVLIVPDADKSHDGNYTCKPSNAMPAHINVHVLNATEEENPAAMLHANEATATTFSVNALRIITTLSILILHLASNR